MHDRAGEQGLLHLGHSRQHGGLGLQDGAHELLKRAGSIWHQVLLHQGGYLPCRKRLISFAGSLIMYLYGNVIVDLLASIAEVGLSEPSPTLKVGCTWPASAPTTRTPCEGRSYPPCLRLL